MEKQSNCNKLAARFEEKAADGLLDVKFYVRNTEDAVAESVCREVNRLYDAVENNEATVLDFKDVN